MGKSISETDFCYKTETESLLNMLDPDELNKCYKYEYCELDKEFIGFIHSYKDLSQMLSKDTVIIDIGAAQALQSEYFRKFSKYIAVEPAIPKNYIYSMPNSTVYEMTGEDFIRNILPELQKHGLDLRKTFCVCSYVPDEKLRNVLIPKTFPYFRTTYAGIETEQVLPVMSGKIKKRSGVVKGSKNI